MMIRTLKAFAGPVIALKQGVNDLNDNYYQCHSSENEYQHHQGEGEVKSLTSAALSTAA
ncbi:hypothetical protein [Pectobacterium versatile]|uniref:hypothetical protein n=1 Tax=Pectobacterium versatile TaxID=2488639 RepID=UPI0030171931